MFAAASAHPNIAFIKYWGNRDSLLRLPLTGSLSMNLDGLETRTRVWFDADFSADSFSLGGVEQGRKAWRAFQPFWTARGSLLAAAFGRAWKARTTSRPARGLLPPPRHLPLSPWLPAPPSA